MERHGCLNLPTFSTWVGRIPHLRPARHLLLALLFCACSPTAPPPPRPQSLVILISIDTLRADRLGAYGNQDSLTPHLDRFSREAMLFARVHSQACSTLPSHASIFTSCYPAQLKLVGRSRHWSIPEDVPTLFQVLRRAGYTTVSFNGGGFLNANYGFGREVDILAENLEFDDSVPRVLQLIETRKNGTGEAADKPLFVFLHSYEVHTPYGYNDLLARRYDLQAAHRSYSQGITRLISRYRGEPMRLQDVVSLSAHEQALLLCLTLLEKNRYAELIHEDSRDEVTRYLTRVYAEAHWPALPEYAAQRRLVERCYDIGVREADAALGRLFTGLKRMGIWSESMVVVCADHGEEFMDHGVVTHPPLFYETLIHTPLLIKPSGRFTAGVLTGPAGNIDISPTICDAGGIEPPPGTMGMSLLRDGWGTDRIDLSEEASDEKTELRVALTTDRYKLIQLDKENSRIFDLEADPGEVREAGQEALTAMKGYVEWAVDRIHKSGPQPGQEPETAVKIDPELRERLQHLGYIE
ncbi:sulfatase [bacterium]|nr:sulfatase [candidate division CSSED10-310 bacterium]